MAVSATWSLADLKSVIAQHWGYRTLRPLQEEAMRAVLDGRDSLVVLPTGGGKSLCYQAPAVLRGDVTVVVSPLISLMKDQVDRLRSCGIGAVALNSTLSTDEYHDATQALTSGEARLLFVSPERLARPGCQRLLQRLDVRTFAIDEAHCISHWGHDFRPDYRQLNRLREFFPNASVHGYTATATERVRRDIVAQLGFKDPEVHVGNFDRPNLTYRVQRRGDLMKQVRDVLDRHRGEAGILYCITRKDVDELAATLEKRGLKVRAYHAGLNDDLRRGAQEAFMSEECDLIVATVAFGMGIDRSNIRFVLHRGMPKSLEHYQQEAGRAGRDGLEAECVLLYDEEDVELWHYILDKAGERGGVPEGVRANAERQLGEMLRYCRGTACRHRALVQYFGQEYTAPSCGACDLCLGDARPIADSVTLAQKILSCVARVKEGFGAAHVADVLLGTPTDEVQTAGHDSLSTFGLLRGHDGLLVLDWVGQLLAQGLLGQRGAGEPALCLTAASWEVMRGVRSARLIEPANPPKVKASRAAAAAWKDVDRELFEGLRQVRQKLARERGLAPDVILSDLALRELARVKPRTVEEMKRVYGMGQVKVRDFGAAFLEAIRTFSPP